MPGSNHITENHNNNKCRRSFSYTYFFIGILLFGLFGIYLYHKHVNNVIEITASQFINHHKQQALPPNRKHQEFASNEDLEDYYYPNAINIHDYSTLAGTEIDGALNIDEQGNFIPDREALRLFDYFFQLSGQASDLEIMETIQQFITETLQQPALSQAFHFLDQYLFYRKLASQLFSTGEDIADVSSRYVIIDKIRKEAFGEELSRQLFSDDYEVLARIQRQEIINSGTLTEQQQQEMLNEIAASFSEHEEKVLSRSEKMRYLSAHANDENIHETREKMFGYEAAERLSQLDQHREEWNNKLASYRKERGLIENNSALSSQQKQQQIESLQQQYFTDKEILRVKVIESTQGS